MSVENDNLVDNIIENRETKNHDNSIVKEELLEDLFCYLTRKGMRIQQHISYTIISDENNIVEDNNRNILETIVPSKNTTPTPVNDVHIRDEWDYSLIDNNENLSFPSESYKNLSDDDFYTDHLTLDTKLFTAPKKKPRNQYRYHYKRNRGDIYGYPFTVNNLKQRRIIIISCIIILLLTTLTIGGSFFYNKIYYKPVPRLTGVDITQQYLSTPSHTITGVTVIPTATSKLTMTTTGFYSDNGTQLIEFHDNKHEITTLNVAGHEFIHTNLTWGDLGYQHATDSPMWGETTPKTLKTPITNITDISKTLRVCLQEKVEHHDPSLTFTCPGFTVTLHPHTITIDTSSYQLHITNTTPEEHDAFTVKLNEVTRSIGVFQLLYPTIFVIPTLNPDIVCSRSQCTVTRTVSVRSVDGENYKNINSIETQNIIYNRKGTNIGSCTVLLVNKFNVKQNYTCIITGLTSQPDQPRIDYTTLITVNSDKYVNTWLQSTRKSTIDYIINGH